MAVDDGFDGKVDQALFIRLASRIDVRIVNSVLDVIRVDDVFKDFAGHACGTVQTGY
jgi:hypothetical protein